MPTVRIVHRMMINRSAARTVLLQRRILAIVTSFAAFGILLWVVAISTDYWCVIDGEKGVPIPKTKIYFLQSHNGLWRDCRTLFYNKTAEHPPLIADHCAYFTFQHKNNTENEETFIHYRRSMAAFSIISLIVLLMAFSFSYYTFTQTRYMYKRLAAGTHIIAACCVMTVIELCSTSIRFATNYLQEIHPPGSVSYYGFSYVIAWITFTLEIISAISFAICSRKKKKDKAPDDNFAIEEEPTILGR